MRDYGKVSPKFWIGQTGKALRQRGQMAQLVGLYLITSPHANMLGLYYLPMAFVAHETGLGLQGASKGLKGCIEAGFCMYDEESEMVWVMEMARFQIADVLSGKDLRIKGVQNEYNSLPENPYLAAFYDMYSEAFCMSHKRGISIPLKGALKGLASQEQEQEQEQDQEQAQEQTFVERRYASPDHDPVPDIFAYWQKTMGHPGAKLDKKRIGKIRAGLDLGYTPRQLCEAIKGCSRSPHHMGQNDRNTKYNTVDLIFRSADYIDKFIELANQNVIGTESLEQRNARIMAEFLNGDGGKDLNIIDMEELDA